METVTVPRWALEFILRGGYFWDDGPSGEGWPSPEMDRALEALNSALSLGPSASALQPHAR
jgi:hypothetical protein